MLQNQSFSVAKQRMLQTSMHTSKRIFVYLVTGKQHHSEIEPEEMLRGFQFLMRRLEV